MVTTVLYWYMCRTIWCWYGFLLLHFIKITSMSCHTLWLVLFIKITDQRLFICCYGSLLIEGCQVYMYWYIAGIIQSCLPCVYLHSAYNMLSLYVRMKDNTLILVINNLTLTAAKVKVMLMMSHLLKLVTDRARYLL